MAKDLISVIDDEHATIKRLFKELRDDPKDISELVSFLVTHEVAEETVPFPKARSMPGGEEMVSERLEEQQSAEKKLDAIEEITDIEERKQALRALEQDIIEHAEEEENTVYKLLADNCTEDELNEMGEKFLRVKSMAPTHPHPNAPDTPPFNKVMGPAAGLADKLRDKVKNM